MTDPIAEAARFLGTQVEYVRHQPWADEFLDAVEKCLRRIRATTDGPAPKRYLGPCGALPEDIVMTNSAAIVESCEGDVYGVVGGKTGTCRTCGAQVAQDERRAWLDDQVRGQAFRAAHIADAYGINVNTIRTWARDQPEVRADNGVVVRKARPAKLRAHGYDRDDKPLYLVGDVLDLARAAAIRRAENEARRERRESVEVGA